MLLEIIRLLKNKYGLDYKTSINLIIYLQECNQNFDDLKTMYNFIKEYDDNINQFIESSKYEYIQ